MLQQDAPEDFVLATGETHPVREFVEKSFAVLGITVKWRGTGTEEEGYDEKTGKVIVRVDPRYFRPAEVEYVFAFHSCCRRGDSEADHGHCAQASPRRPREGGPAPWMEAQSRLPLAREGDGAGRPGGVQDPHREPELGRKWTERANDRERRVATRGAFLAWRYPSQYL